MNGVTVTNPLGGIFPYRSESNVVHRYVRPGVYTLRVECSGGNGGGEMDDVSAQTVVVIGGHRTELRDLTCHSGDLLSAEDGCTALLGRPLEVRMNGASGKKAEEQTRVVSSIHPFNLLSIILSANFSFINYSIVKFENPDRNPNP